MAYFNITTNKKGVLTAKIQAYGVDLETMKRKVRYKRITNDDGLSRAKFTKLVEREANTFEDSLNELYQKALNGERTEILSFPKLAEEWLQRTKTTLSINYYVRSSKIVEKFNASCTEMEGAAIAHAAYLNQVPCVIIRAISDKADNSAEMDYPTFEKLAIERSVKLVKNLLPRI